MITSRLLALQLMLVGGLSSVFLLPKDIRIQPAAISLQLPEVVGDWSGKDVPVSEGEKQILGRDTQFARKIYSLGDDQIFVSIVLSGPDMNTSIHRPERCLPAQGWTIIDSKVLQVPVKGHPLDVTRLDDVQNVPVKNGQTATIHSLNYYWFVGHEDTTASHLRRTWIDVRDRVLRGENQQWAYVTVMAYVTKEFRVFGKDTPQTDAMLRDFVSNLAPRLTTPTVASTR